MGFGKKPELLAPAGSPESVLAAVRCGADAVYAGGERFSARANAVNFSDSELEKAVRYCHLHGVRLYRAMNTLIFPEEMRDFLAAAKKSAEMGVDGLIVQDLGAAVLLREMLPDMRLNASTQMTVHTPEGARLAAEIGFSRIVAARELSMKQLAELTGTGVEIETFIHGALCMSVSGQCYMSAVIGSRSANRGMCAQACRLPFSALGTVREERYDLSLKDLCGIPHIGRLAEMGVSALKIEGRMKRPEYVAAAVTACRAAIDGDEPDLDALRAVFSRSGFTDGYMTGMRSEMFGYRQKEDVVAAETVLPALKESYRKEVKGGGDSRADFRFELKSGKPARLEMICGGITVSAEGAIPEKAVKRPADLEYVSRQLEKLGDTVYTLSNITAEIDGESMISASAINALRRETVHKMDEAIIAAAKPKQRYKELNEEIFSYKSSTEKPHAIRVSVSRAEQLEGIDEDIPEIVVPLEMCGAVSADGRFILSLPRFVTDEDRLKERLAAAKAAGFGKILCTNISHVKIGRDMGFEMSGGFGLNVTNPFTAKTLAGFGVRDITASFEAKLPQLARISGGIKTCVIIYGRLPVMLTRNCPIKQAVKSCNKCTKCIIDRTGRRFPVRCAEGKGYCEIFNCDPLMMTDRVGDIRADAAELDFTDESAAEVRRIIKCCKNGAKALKKGYTRGLYYRGID